MHTRNQNSFSETNYQSIIQNYCSAAGLEILGTSRKNSVINITLESGSTHSIIITKHNEFLEFLCLSGAMSADKDDFAEAFQCVNLLKSNSRSKIGFWCLKKVDNEYVLGVRHKVEFEMLEANYFEEVIKELAKLCELFELTSQVS